MRAMYAAEPGRFFFATDEAEPLAAIFVFTFGQRARHKVLRYGIAGPRPENLDEEDPLWGVYRFKVGFGGETTNFLGCLDLPLKEVCAAAWYRFESAYHQLY